MSQSSLHSTQILPGLQFYKFLQVFSNDQKEVTAEKNDKEVKEKEGGLSVITRQIL